MKLMVCTVYHQILLLLVLLLNSAHRFPTSTTFYCDGVWNDNVGEMAIILGGDIGDVDSVGIFSMFSWSVYEWCAGASISRYLVIYHILL